jgi:hypothetical protein
MKFGARYRCPQCDISFSRIDTLQNHLELSHSGNVPLNNMKRILILGGGFGGTAVLRKLQNRFQRDVSVDIAMVSKDNYLLFTPMLHEIASGMIETRHIVIPIRAFCNRSRFYCAKCRKYRSRKQACYNKIFVSHTHRWIKNGFRNRYKITTLRLPCYCTRK